MTGQSLLPSSFWSPLLTSSPLSSYSLLTLSLSCRCIRHHERFTALLLTDLANPPHYLTQTNSGNPPPLDLSLSRKTMQRWKQEIDRQQGKGRGTGAKLTEEYKENCVCVYVCVDWVFGVPHGGVCCERLSEHVMCDRWRTVSISSLTHTYVNTRTHPDTVDRYEQTSPDVAAGKILMLV